MNLRQSIYHIAQSIADATEPERFHPTEYQLSGQEVGDLCKDVKDHVYVWDNTYLALTMVDWQIVFDDVLRGLPKYVAEKFDCEDFSFLVTSRVLEKYQLNSCGFAVGQSPRGYHGFNVFVVKGPGSFALHTLEPQNGQIDPKGYEPEVVIFG